MAEEEFDVNEPITLDSLSDDDLTGEDDEDNIIDPAEVDMDFDIDLEGDEDELDYDDEMNELDMELGLDLGDDLGDDLGIGDDLGEPSEIQAPELDVKWTSVPQSDGSIRSEHIDGFVLRAKPLSVKSGNKIKWAVQLVKDGKIIEKGVKLIDSSKDANVYLQNVSDRVLDKRNLVNKSLEGPKEKPGAKKPPADEMLPEEGPPEPPGPSESDIDQITDSI